MQTYGPIEPIKLYGSSISYFTGKLENYFRVRDIQYELISMRFPGDKKRLESAVGVMQMPAIQLNDGRWMTDSTKIIQWFEQHYPNNGLMPRDPALAFLCLLIEDYADEWLWRPAMHYRWHYTIGAKLQSRHLADEVLQDMALPGPLKRAFMRHRQRSSYTTGDGITKNNIPGIEASFLTLLASLERILSTRAFLLGDRPSVADIGLSGPFFRHFALDVVPLQIIRHQAPAVLEWVARLWNSRSAQLASPCSLAIYDDLGPIFDEISNAYLPYLNANVQAIRLGKKHFDACIDNVDYRKARSSRYRVWCLQELQTAFRQLEGQAATGIETLLRQHKLWDALWQESDLPIDDEEQDLPFQASNKMLSVN